MQQCAGIHGPLHVFSRERHVHGLHANPRKRQAMWQNQHTSVEVSAGIALTLAHGAG